MGDNWNRRTSKSTTKPRAGRSNIHKVTTTFSFITYQSSQTEAEAPRPPRAAPARGSGSAPQPRDGGARSDAACGELRRGGEARGAREPAATASTRVHAAGTGARARARASTHHLSIAAVRRARRRRRRRAGAPRNGAAGGEVLARAGTPHRPGRRPQLYARYSWHKRISHAASTTTALVGSRPHARDASSNSSISATHSIAPAAKPSPAGCTAANVSTNQ